MTCRFDIIIPCIALHCIDCCCGLSSVQVAATPETDGGVDPEEGEGAAPMDSDNGAVGDSQKRSPGEVSGPESGQCEPEADGDDNVRTETTSRDARAGEMK
jgi:THO complex subunit 1